ncbi:MAG: PorT family protein [Ferruginibacter sp.]|nr:PorT family protein [Ferruginibacter sp.]
MKWLFAVLFLFFLNPACAQFKVGEDRENFFRFGGRVGVNINKIEGTAYSKGYHFNFQTGVFVQINFSRKLGIQPEVNFLQSSSTFSDDATEVYDDIFRDGSQIKAKMNYLEIPVLLNINVGPSKRVKLQFGPVYGVMLNESVDSLLHNGNIFKRNNWSVTGGLWLQLPFVNLSGRYKYGLSNLNNTSNGYAWKNQAIQIGVGITF